MVWRFSSKRYMRAFAAFGGGGDILHGEGTFAGAGGPHEEHVGPARDAAAKEPVEFFQAAGDDFAVERRVMFGGNEAREDAQSAAGDDEIVEPAAKAHAAKLHDAQAAAFGTVFGRGVIELEDAVGNGVRLRLSAIVQTIVQQDDRGVFADKVLLQRENLAAKAQRALGEQAELGQRIEHHSGWMQALEFVEKHLGHFVQLDFRRMKERVFRGGETLLGGGELKDVDPIQGPAVAGGDGAELIFGLGQRNEENAFALLDAFEQELECEGGFPGARLALDEVYAFARQPATEDVVETLDTSAAAGGS